MKTACKYDTEADADEARGYFHIVPSLRNATNFYRRKFEEIAKLGLICFGFNSHMK